MMMASYGDMAQHEESSEEVMPRSNDNASLSSSETETSTNDGVNNNYKSINEKQAHAKSDNETAKWVACGE